MTAVKVHNLTKTMISGIMLVVYIPSKYTCKSVFPTPIPEKPGCRLMSRPAFKAISLDLVTEFIDVLNNLRTMPQSTFWGHAPEEGQRIKWQKNMNTNIVLFLCGQHHLPM